MSYDTSSVEEILQVLRIRGNDSKWCPAVRIVGDHEGDAVWVAALFYSIYSQYISSIPDSEQHQFEKDVKEALELVFDQGMNHLDVLTCKGPKDFEI